MRSWLQKHFPDDKEKERQLLYYIAESTLILLLLLFFYMGLLVIMDRDGIPPMLLIPLIFLFVSGYVWLRYIFAGLEYSEVHKYTDYKRRKKQNIYQTFIFIGIYLFISFLIEWPLSKLMEWIDIIGPASLAGFLFYIISLFSLKKSYKRNTTQQ
ncbi:hypothetical protein [Halobacillus litoralis]|uniref:DUF3278 domain-containing protein n=1 Tax=Halobacillus litoralis TaxID=45668 RepID=A0A410MBI0_9BACI|nr:hypothetical protein [Halobacillus litoralis]QAS52099.1 hypothetical protein HLI_07610 [Halobacillus litoralis]